MAREVWSEIIERIKAAHNILVFSHHSPDPDAFGSSCGLTLALIMAGKNCVCVNADGAAKHLSHIPHATKVLDHIPEGNWDLSIVCDCGDIERVGMALPEGVTIINIDHHISNSNYGDLNLVLPEASSASEVIFEVVSDLLGALTPEIASALLTGIIADTGGFRYSSASAYTFAIAEKLIKAGADHVAINRNLFSNRKLSATLLAADVVRRLKLHAEGRVVELVATAEQQEQFGAEPSDAEGIVELGRDIAGVEVSIFIRKFENLWKVSLRSKTPEVNVSDIAATFGGGGHIQAAAFRWSGKLEDLRERLIAKVIEALP